MKKKKFNSTPLQISNLSEIPNLQKEYSWSQYIELKCEKCGKVFQRRLAHTNSLLCRNCQREQSCIEKYGVPHHNQSSSIKEKKARTCLERYGYSTNLQSEDTKKKITKTCLERYGVEHALQSKEVREKIVTTCLERYGVENIHQVESVLQKTRNTNLERYGTISPLQSPNILERIKQHNLDTYGVDSFSKTEEFKNRISELDKIRWANLSEEERRSIRQKQSNKWKLMWNEGGVLREHWNNLTDEERRVIRQKQSTQLKLCWGENGLLREYWNNLTDEELREIRQKASYKMKLNWGNLSDEERKSRGKSISESLHSLPLEKKIEARKKAAKKYNYQDITFDSSWELAYFLYLIDHNIEFEFQCDPIEYFVNEKKHLYFPDFKVGNQYVEIKGDHFFTKDGKFVNPFLRTLEEDTKNEAKYNCMKDHNVQILRSQDMKPILEYVDLAFGNSFIENCRMRKNL